ncbi:MAG: dTDP-4-dehydrorhamnose 3,5-epimerase [Lachnospiraceae bacterium]|nr:dTDP-4-dehydrorhamnose 3,5-epimerase [Lachnospiraceae bacterium]
MGELNVIKNPDGIEGLRVITPKVFGDERGYFLETFSERDLKEQAGIDVHFVQDNQSRSKQGVLRGMHFQKQYPQAKLLRVTEGEVFDVAVDLRKGSATYGKVYSVVLSSDNFRQFFIPAGFAHGILVTSEYAILHYKCTDYYHPEDEGGLKWDDETVNIPWPLEKVGGREKVVLSLKDKSNYTLQEIMKLQSEGKLNF